MKLWEALRSVREDPYDVNFGICNNADIILNTGQCMPVYELIANAAPNWIGCSSDLAYPVGGASEYYSDHDGPRMLRPKRQEFLNWLIDYFKQLDI